MKIHINFVTIFRDINSMSSLILFISLTPNILKHINKNKLITINHIISRNTNHTIIMNNHNQY
jgi:hypothetical protein